MMTNLPRATLFSRIIAMTMAAAATIVVVAGSASPASAAGFATSHSVVVDLSGIDLASAAGEARIADAVAHAVRQVCADGGDRSLTGSRARRACIATARDAALPQLAARVDAARAARTALADASPLTATVNR